MWWWWWWWRGHGFEIDAVRIDMIMVHLRVESRQDNPFLYHRIDSESTFGTNILCLSFIKDQKTVELR